ncbi:Uncharacterized protein GBIM_16041 [Gryllus bimaculatus]|nr:Uncharacterized protein GBIM_16041 [Gryllus bimaculatus]
MSSYRKTPSAVRTARRSVAWGGGNGCAHEPAARQRKRPCPRVLAVAGRENCGDGDVLKLLFLAVVSLHTRDALSFDRGALLNKQPLPNVLSCSPLRVLSVPLSEKSWREIVTLPTETGCYYNFQHYEEGDRIITNEPCLNCTCHNRMLMCYLRVCPFSKAIGQDCTVEKKPEQCCPVITCPEVPVQLVTSSTTAATPPAPTSGSSAVGHPDNYGCTIDEVFYTDGAKVPGDSSKPCELCYCIRNRTACVMQECTLHVEGCQPVYADGVCCPVRYDCDYQEATEATLPETTVRPTPGLILTTTPGPLDCQHDNEVYADGAMLPNTNPCEFCYCMKGDIVCAVQECGTPLEREGKNCTALPPQPGSCCPQQYQCEPEISQANDLSLRQNRKHEHDADDNGTLPLDIMNQEKHPDTPESSQPSSDNEPTTQATPVEPSVVDNEIDSPGGAIIEQSTSDEDSPTIAQKPETTDGETPASHPIEEKVPEPSVVEQDHEQTISQVDQSSDNQHPVISETEQVDQSSDNQHPIISETEQENIPPSETSPATIEHVKPAENEGAIQESTAKPEGSDGIIEQEQEHKPEGNESPVSPSEEKPSEQTDSQTSAGELDSTEKPTHLVTEPVEAETTVPPASPDETTLPSVDEHVPHDHEKQPIDEELPSEASTDQPLQESSPSTTSHEASSDTSSVDESTNVPVDENIITTDAIKPEVSTDSPVESTSVPEQESQTTGEASHEDPSDYSTPSAESEQPEVPEHVTEAVISEFPESTDQPQKLPSTYAPETVTEGSGSDSQGTEQESTLSPSPGESDESEPALGTSTEGPSISDTAKPDYSSSDTTELPSGPSTSSEEHKPEDTHVSDEHTTSEQGTGVQEETHESSEHPPTEPVLSETEIPDQIGEQPTQAPDSVTGQEDEKEVTSQSVEPSEAPEHHHPSIDQTSDTAEGITESGIKVTEKVDDLTSSEIITGGGIAGAPTTVPEQGPEGISPTESTPAHGIVPGEGNCLVEGQSYQNNSAIPPLNPCVLSCRCVSSIVHCVKVTCSPPPAGHKNCIPVKDKSDACCDTYLCDGDSTPTLESDSHMAGGATTGDGKLPESTQESVDESATGVPESGKPETSEESSSLSPEAVEAGGPEHTSSEGEVSSGVSDSSSEGAIEHEKPAESIDSEHLNPTSPEPIESENPEYSSQHPDVHPIGIVPIDEEGASISQKPDKPEESQEPEHPLPDVSGVDETLPDEQIAHPGVTSKPEQSLEIDHTDTVQQTLETDDASSKPEDHEHPVQTTDIESSGTSEAQRPDEHPVEPHGTELPVEMEPTGTPEIYQPTLLPILPVEAEGTDAGDSGKPQTEQPIDAELPVQPDNSHVAETEVPEQPPSSVTEQSVTVEYPSSPADVGKPEEPTPFVTEKPSLPEQAVEQEQPSQPEPPTSSGSESDQTLPESSTSESETGATEQPPVVDTKPSQESVEASESDVTQPEHPEETTSLGESEGDSIVGIEHQEETEHSTQLPDEDHEISKPSDTDNQKPGTIEPSEIEGSGTESTQSPQPEDVQPEQPKPEEPQPVEYQPDELPTQSATKQPEIETQTDTSHPEVPHIDQPQPVESQPDEPENVNLPPTDQPQTEQFQPEETLPDQEKPEEPQPVDVQTEHPYTEQPQTELSQTEQSHFEQTHPEQPQTGEHQPVEAQPEQIQTEEPQPVEAETEPPQAGEAQPVEAQTELSQTGEPQPVEAQTEPPQTGEPQPIDAQTELPQTGEPQPVEAETGEPQPIEAQPEQPQTGEPQPVEAQTESPQTGESQPVEAQPEQPQTGHPQPVEAQTESPQTGEPQPVEAQTELSQTGEPQPIEAQTESPQTGEPQPVEAQTESPQTGEPQPVEPQTEAPQTGDRQPVEVQPESPNTEQPQTEQAQTELSQPDESPSEQHKPEEDYSEHPITEQLQTETPQTEQSQPEVPHPEEPQPDAPQPIESETERHPVESTHTEQPETEPQTILPQEIQPEHPEELHPVTTKPGYPISGESQTEQSISSTYPTEGHPTAHEETQTPPSIPEAKPEEDHSKPQGEISETVGPVEASEAEGSTTERYPEEVATTQSHSSPGIQMSTEDELHIVTSSPEDSGSPNRPIDGGSLTLDQDADQSSSEPGQEGTTQQPVSHVEISEQSSTQSAEIGHVPDEPHLATTGPLEPESTTYPVESAQPVHPQEPNVVETDESDISGPSTDQSHVPLDHSEAEPHPSGEDGEVQTTSEYGITTPISQPEHAQTSKTDEPSELPTPAPTTFVEGEKDEETFKPTEIVPEEDKQTPGPVEPVESEQPVGTETYPRPDVITTHPSDQTSTAISEAGSDEVSHDKITTTYRPQMESEGSQASESPDEGEEPQMTTENVLDEKPTPGDVEPSVIDSEQPTSSTDIEKPTETEHAESEKPTPDQELESPQSTSASTLPSDESETEDHSETASSVESQPIPTTTPSHSEEPGAPEPVVSDTDDTASQQKPVDQDQTHEQSPDISSHESSSTTEKGSSGGVIEHVTQVSHPIEHATIPGEGLDTSTKKPIDEGHGSGSSTTPAVDQKPQHPSHPSPDYENFNTDDGWYPPSTDEDWSEGSFGPGTCRYGGKLYVSAQQIPRDDPCDFCFCFRSDIICLRQSCPPPIPDCHQEPIEGFCCPRYQCEVSTATMVNVSTTTTTTTTTLPPHFLSHAYKGAAVKTGCLLQGKSYKVGEKIQEKSTPCLECLCGGNGDMQCNPRDCQPEPMLRKMIMAAASRRR